MTLSARATTPLDTHLGRRIRARRNELGLSQDDVAGKLGITFQQLQKYERGANRVSGARLAHLACVLEVEPAYFFAGAPGGRRKSAASISLADELMSTRDGVVIAESFVRIGDPTIRRSIASLVEAMAAGRMQAAE